jgi:hypothetical protein
LIALPGWQRRKTFCSSKRPSRLRKLERQIQSERKCLAKLLKRVGYGIGVE